ncbi:hypothetical protein OUZ56_007470 [Daphnia magna]|uniref:Uncharacterized protein n=1 Tax=Daphnia magna TaxID=35525 RepID=A0ABR0AA88_9CRUS|nr:hypothetical protein OUZ56_007470 [Daphnia magna]
MPPDAVWCLLMKNDTNLCSKKISVVLCGCADISFRDLTSMTEFPASLVDTYGHTVIKPSSRISASIKRKTRTGINFRILEFAEHQEKGVEMDTHTMRGKQLASTYQSIFFLS